MPILVIEDDVSLSHLMLAIFRRMGLDAEVAGRGDVGIGRIEACGDRYEAIILDLMLPGLSGLEILERLATMKPDLLARTIVVTAASNRVLEELNCMPAPRRVIRKPFDLDEFRAVVLDCVREVRAPQAR